MAEGHSHTSSPGAQLTCAISDVSSDHGALTLPSPPLSRCSRKEHRKSLGSHGSASGETVVTYFFCGEEIPYRRTMSSHSLTLGHFKEQLRKKGNYRCAHSQRNLVWELLRVRENHRLMWEHLAARRRPAR